MPAVTAVTAAQGGAVPPKSGKQKLMVVLAAALALVLVLGGGGLWLVKQKAAQAAALAAGDDESGVSEPAHAAARPEGVGLPVYLPLDPFIVNLADKDVDRYAQIGITLELENPVFADRVKAYMPAVRNAILLVLAQKSSRDLLGRSGKEDLADEIMREAVRPMGIDIPAPEPVSGTAAQDEAPVRTSRRAKKAPVRNPVQHVHFSSFIIQ